MRQFMVLGVHNNYRQSVREPVSNKITLRLADLSEPGVFDRPGAEIQMTVPQMIEHIATCAQALGEFCRRADVADALRRTDPGPCAAVLGLKR